MIAPHGWPGRPTDFSEGEFMIRAKILLLVTLGLISGCVNSSEAPSTDAPNPDLSESGDSLPNEPPLTQQEMTSLKGIHHTAVEQFAALPSFGGDRMVLRMPIEDAITPPVSSEFGTTAKREADNSLRSLAQKAGQPRREIHQSFHNLLGRAVILFQGETWKLKGVQLVGLTVHPNPVVYESDKVPGMKEVVEIPTRELNSFEKRGLKALKKGEPLKYERRDGEVRLMGPIFSGKMCIHCHQQPGQMLGAFSYVFERSPAGEVIAP